MGENKRLLKLMQDIGTKPSKLNKEIQERVIKAKSKVNTLNGEQRYSHLLETTKQNKVKNISDDNHNILLETFKKIEYSSFRL